MELQPTWSGLLQELLEEIVRRIRLVEDFLAFRGICTTWRSAATKVKFSKIPRIPLLMLSENKDDDDHELYNLSKRKIGMRITLPEAKGKRLTGVKFGWLLTLSNSGEVTLLNPISRAQIHLPNIKSFASYQDECPDIFPISCTLLSDNPSDNPSNFVLFVASKTMLGYWSAGDKYWIRIPTDKDGCVRDFEHYKNQLYIAFSEHIVVWDPCENDDLKVILLLQEANSRLRDAHFKRPRKAELFHNKYLVESSHGNLLLITRVCYDSNSRGDKYYSFKTIGFDVMQIDVVNGECTEMNSLENDAIFVGKIAGISIPAADLPDTIKPNCIYFTNDHYHRNTDAKLIAKDMGIYRIHKDGKRTINRFNIDYTNLICSPLWIDSSIIMNSL